MIQLKIRILHKILIRVVNMDMLSKEVQDDIKLLIAKLNGMSYCRNVYSFISYEEALWFIRELSAVYDIMM